MKYVPVVLVILFFSCSDNNYVEKYNRIVDESDAIAIYTKKDESFNMVKEINAENELTTFKYILKRDVKSNSQRKFVTKTKIELKQNGKLSGTLFINDSEDHAYANFNTNDFDFGFELPYGIAVYVSDLQ